MSVQLSSKSNLKNKKNDEKLNDNPDNEMKMMEAELYNWLIMSAYPGITLNRKNKKNNNKSKQLKNINKPKK